MDDFLFNALHEEATPKMNPLIANGFVTEALRPSAVEGYIDNVFQCAAKTMPPQITYEGGVRCTPLEEYQEITRKKNSKHTFELSRSDVYMMKYYFSFEGRRLPPQYLYLPFVRDGGLMYINGSCYCVSPVLADRAISVGTNNVFIPLLRDKLTFDRLSYAYVVDDQVDNTYVIWSKIHHGKGRVTHRTVIGTSYHVDAQSTLGHYLFCKYGVSRTFAQFAGTEIITGEDLNRDDYPKDEWVFCCSKKLKPKGVKSRAYIPSRLCIVVPRKNWSPLVQSLLGTLFYVADHYPDRILSEYLDDTNLWCIVMGHVIYCNASSEGKHLENILNHLNSLDDYVDEVVKERLRDEDIHCEDIYELFIHLMHTMADMLINTDMSNIYDKVLLVRPYVCRDIVRAIFQTTYSLNSNKKKALTEREAKNIFAKYLRLETILDLKKNHGEVSNISYPGDNKIFKYTTNLVPQSNATGESPKKKKQKKSSENLSDPSKFLHTSVIEVCSYGNLSKAMPDGKSRLNVFYDIQPDGVIRRNPEKAKILAPIQQMIRR